MLRILLIGSFLLPVTLCLGQDSTALLRDSLVFKGELISWLNVNPANELPFAAGLRYLPQLNYRLPLPTPRHSAATAHRQPRALRGNRLFDIEASANIFANANFRPFDSLRTNGLLKPYRLWARYSGPQWEVRAGLQKINFGSAILLRPLMWFDQIDPRDPIQFTDGVWGVLGRYYFLNNANLWLWGLYGNHQRRGWDLAPTSSRRPEWGGRFQQPLPKGEMALSVHHRQADTRSLESLMPAHAAAPETRLGFDVKMDWAVGCWLEASWTANHRDLGAYRHQEMLNLGIDYTWGIGNGLYMAAEQLLVSYDEQAFRFSRTNSLSLLSLSYPIGFFDNLGAMVYYDWSNDALYRFVNWRKQWNNATLFVMAYWNPQDSRLPTQSSTQNPYSGAGVQIIFLWNH